MASWYVGSVQYSAVTQWSATTVFVVGDIRRQLAAPAVGSERCFRCTTAGTSGGAEPAWVLTKGATTNDNTVVWTEVTGNSIYNWAAASARGALMVGNFAAAGDNVYVAQNNAETQVASLTWSSVGTSASPLNIFCVNAAGSVPPVAADLATTGTVSTTAGGSITLTGHMYIYGLTFTAGNAANNVNFIVANGSNEYIVFEACKLAIGSTNTSARMILGNAATTPSKVILRNTSLSFANASQGLNAESQLTWRGAASSLQGTVPTTFILGTATGAGTFLIQGVDLSAAGAGKTLVGAGTGGPLQVALVQCQLNASVTVAATPTSSSSATTDLIVSDSTSSANRQERYRYEGTLTREATVVRAGGATDPAGTAFSWKIVATANAKNLFPFETFTIPFWVSATGSQTKSIAVLTDGVTLTDAECWMEVQYLGNASFPLASGISDGLATPLTVATNQTTDSTSSWTTTGIVTPIKQVLSVTFTTNLIGLHYAVVKVAKASATVYIDPKVT